MTDQPTRQAIAAQGRSGKLTVSGKLKVAIDLMLEGSRRNDAAMAAGMKPHSLREAMKKTHVRAYFNRGLEVLRVSERARNILALAAVRDTSGNDMARVSAAKALEQLADNEASNRTAYSAPMQPGMQIVIINAPEAKQPPTIDVTPNKSNDGD